MGDVANTPEYRWTFSISDQCSRYMISRFTQHVTFPKDLNEIYAWISFFLLFYFALPTHRIFGRRGSPNSLTNYSGPTGYKRKPNTTKQLKQQDISWRSRVRATLHFPGAIRHYWAYINCTGRLYSVRRVCLWRFSVLYLMEHGINFQVNKDR